jgi:hypothetical protein
MKTKLLLLFTLLVTFLSSNAQINSVAVVGAGVGGWPTGAAGEVDANQLTRVTPGGDDWIIENLVVSGPGIKIRANNSWTDAAGGGGNWGRPTTGSQWPTATADEGGGSGDINTGVIPGTYTLTFNTTTKVYNFAGGPPIPLVNILGSAVTPATGIPMTATSATTFTTTAVFLTGLAQFDIASSIIGGDTFPTGTVSDPGLSIPVAAGNWVVTIDIESGEYSFTNAFVVRKVAIVGAGTTAGWPAGTPGEIDPLALKNVDNLNLNYRISELVLTENPVKLRQDNGWAVSWAGAFPTASATRGGSGDIMVTPAGTYSLTLDYITDTYTFFTPKIGIIGSAIGGWDTANEVQMTTTDGGTIYTLLNQAFVGGDGCKFRLDQNWDKSWKGIFPSGIADTGSGPNIIVPAGSYDVQFNRVTGEFAFLPPGTLATSTFNTQNFSVYPNPTSNTWNFTTSNEAIKSIQIIDLLGKVVATSTSTTVDASSLTAGIYLAKVATENATATVKVVKNYNFINSR